MAMTFDGQEMLCPQCGGADVSSRNDNYVDGNGKRRNDWWVDCRSDQCLGRGHIDWMEFIQHNEERLKASLRHQSMEPVALKSSQIQVLRTLVEMGHGSAAEIAAEMGGSAQQSVVSKRLSELRRLGTVEIDHSKKGDRGRTVSVHVPTDLGRATASKSQN